MTWLPCSGSRDGRSKTWPTCSSRSPLCPPILRAKKTPRLPRRCLAMAPRNHSAGHWSCPAAPDMALVDMTPTPTMTRTLTLTLTTRPKHWPWAASYCMSMSYRTSYEAPGGAPRTCPRRSMWTCPIVSGSRDPGPGGPRPSLLTLPRELRISRPLISKKKGGQANPNLYGNMPQFLL